MKIHVTEDGEIIRAYGNAKPTDTHTLSTIPAVDEEIIEWLARRERPQRPYGSFPKLPRNRT